MSNGLILLTHGDIGRTMLEAARVTIPGARTVHVETVSVAPSADQNDVTDALYRAKTHFTPGEGCLVLTDLYGATPANAACRWSPENGCTVVCGLNLGMLLRALNYINLPIEQLADAALRGAVASARIVPPPEENSD